MNFIKDLSIDKIQNLAEDAFNSAKPKTDVEARVYEVLSHKNWGASGSSMNEIARDTYDAERFQVVSNLMWDGLENQRPAAWKVVFKSLNLLDHLVKNGAERCVDDARNHGHTLRALGQFNYYEGTIDRGLGVREKSKQILEMLGDDERVREERQKARKLREKFGNFNKGKSGMGGGGSAAGPGGYGNQDSWNTDSAGGGGGGGYGEGGIYDNDKAYSGRYGNSSSTASAAAPTFASIPVEKKKSKKKKKKQQQAQVAAPTPAPEPVGDLLGFDDVPAQAPPAAGTGGNNDFGAFQTSSVPTPTAAVAADDFGAFDQIRSKNTQQGPDPFAAAPVAAAPQQQFGAFGNNGGVGVNTNMFVNNTANPTGNMMMNNNMMNNNMMNNNMSNNNMSNNVATMGNSFNNMSVGASAPVGGMQQPQVFPANDDDFGDFADAKTSSSTPTAAKPSDPLAGLINLDSLTKNPSKKMTMNQPVVVNAAAAQYQSDIRNGVQARAPGVDGVVSAGGSDAISSMMGPAPPQQQRGSNFAMNSQASAGAGGMPMNPQMQQQQQFNQAMQSQGMQGGGMNNMMGGMQFGTMYGNQMHMSNQMGGQQQQINPQMVGGMGMQGGVNPQMRNMQGGMNPQMGGQQQMNPQMMGGMGMQGGMGGFR
eukprot:CAMPEP_0168186898 /NCGR_PEP_ID=MMETSP0139_2-20121125/14701_1 /TAXON_ID=44445 /ORGANISM="Pseudo-nitzschia australis, Strain 10249 10 AB" /LENGTH=648 /DNA_ID=CAMNT_0008108983 /DNA_START=123 /DNA_END=2069 /DNA_ORIENTATION=+